MRDFNICIPSTEGIEVLNCNELMYADAEHDYSRIVFKDEGVIEVLLTITELEYFLSKRGFFRFNNTTLVNLRYVQVIFPLDASIVILENGEEISVSKERREDLFEGLKEVFELQEAV